MPPTSWRAEILAKVPNFGRTEQIRQRRERVQILVHSRRQSAGKYSRS